MSSSGNAKNDPLPRITSSPGKSLSKAGLSTEMLGSIANQTGPSGITSARISTVELRSLGTIAGKVEDRSAPEGAGVRS